MSNTTQKKKFKNKQNQKDDKEKERHGLNKEGESFLVSRWESPKKKFFRCFLCNSPHQMWDYPRREKLIALVAKENSKSNE